MDGWVRSALSGSPARFVSPIEALCNGQGCLVSIRRHGVAYPLAHDQSHLTVDGSVMLIQHVASSLLD